MTTFVYGTASDVGRVRHTNQDSLLARPGLYAVADGMGGHLGGEVAAELAVQVIESRAPIVSTQDLIDALHAANEAILERSREDRSLVGMGTTICAVALVAHDDRERLAITNVGDSRVYLFAGERLQQLTEDHSLVQQLVRDGSLSADDASRHPQRNVLTRALGIDARVAVDAWEVSFDANDRFVLCSDGLSNELTDDQIAAVLRRLADPQDAASELVRLANEQGGRDNITVVVVDVRPDAGAPPHPAVSSKERVADMAGFGSAPTAVKPEVDEKIAPTRIVEQAVGAGHARKEVREPRPPIFTVRTVLFLAAFVVVVLIALGAVFWIGRRTYYVAFDATDHVAIYRGRPGGVLWIDPTLAEQTDIVRSQVPPALVATLDKGHDVGSIGAARTYVDNVRQEIKAAAGPDPSPSTTLGAVASTAPAVTTVAPAASATDGSR